MSNALVIGNGIGVMYAEVLQEVVDEVILIDSLVDPDLYAVRGGYFDIVVISVPNFLHEKYARLVADLGLSELIVVDKPGFESADAWQGFAEEYLDINLQMVKNNLFRDTVKEWSDLFESEGATLDIRWHNTNRVPKPGSWFTDKAKSFGGVEVDLLPHLINLVYAVRGKLPEATSMEISQNWELCDLGCSDYGEINEDGVFDVSDYASVSFNDGSVISADWRSMDENDDISIRIFDADGEEILRSDLGLCPCYAYGEMFAAMLRADDEQYEEWFDLDWRVHKIIHGEEIL